MKKLLLILTVFMVSCSNRGASGKRKPQPPDTSDAIIKYFLTGNTWVENFAQRIIKDSVKLVQDIKKMKLKQELTRDTMYKIFYLDTLKIGGRPVIDSLGNPKLSVRTTVVLSKYVIVDYNFNFKRARE